MKQLGQSSCLLFIILLLACRQAPSTVYLEGVLHDYDGNEVFLYRATDRTGYNEWSIKLDSVAIDSNGIFSFTHNTTRSDFYQVAGNNGFPLFQDVYLSPGDSIFITVPVRSDTTHIGYIGARAGAYLVHDKLDSLWRNDTMFMKAYYEIARMDIDPAWDFIRQKYDTRMGIVNDHFAGRPDWEPLAKKFTEDEYYRSATEYFNYLYYYNYYSNDTFLYLVPEPEYYTFLDTYDLGRTPDYFSYEYMSFLSAFLRDHFHRDNSGMADSVLYENMFRLMLNAAQKHLSGEARDLAFMAISYEFPFFLGGDDFFSQLDSMDVFFSENYTTEKYYKHFLFVKSQFDNLRPGNPAPPLALPDINGDTVQLTDFLGKVVYVDFWGTWCYPCLQEMPHSLELQEKFANDPVEFIYVGLQSGDDQLETWRQFVLGETSLSYAPFLEQRKYPGIHLLSEGQFNNPALKPFRIRAAPTYVLIDAEGKIINANAPRPGSDEIEGLIRETLAELQ